jgi:NAD(P)-dependent dehydrogenase (short-subunit alcohol dehydrogenase family)
MAGDAVIESTFRADLFAGKVALVTGSAGGIGAGVAQAFAKLGASVVLQDVDAPGLARRAGELAGFPGGCAAIGGDLAEPGGADAAFDEALQTFGRIDFLVNNAGRSWAVKTADITEAETQALIELNLKAVLWLSRRYILHARERSEGGSIVQISSTAGVAGFEQRAVYCATKFGVIGLTKALALEHGRDAIRINAVMPHVVETDMFRSVARAEEAALWRAGIPMGRFAQVEEVAALVMFLCSPASAYLTGGVYAVDGGAMAGPFGGGA